MEAKEVNLFNLFFIKHYKDLINQDTQIIWQTGVRQFDRINSLINSPKVIVKSFIKNIHVAYSCSDLVISRAGAMAIEELKMFNKAMILIPYPHSAQIIIRNLMPWNYLIMTLLCLLINRTLKKNCLILLIIC